jgi:hypothetical protein
MMRYEDTLARAACQDNHKILGQANTTGLSAHLRRPSSFNQQPERTLS